MFGTPQLVALLILGQRLAEESYAAYNTKRLLDAGAREVGRPFFSVVAVVHLGWIAGLFLLISPNAPVLWPLLGLFVVLQGGRYWVIAALGPDWTHRIVTRDGAPLVRDGPYKLVRHPFYAVTLAETALLPVAFGAWAYAAIMTAIWAVVLNYLIMLEDAALAERDTAPPADGSGRGGTEDQNRV